MPDRHARSATLPFVKSWHARTAFVFVLVVLSVGTLTLTLRTNANGNRIARQAYYECERVQALRDVVNRDNVIIFRVLSRVHDRRLSVLVRGFGTEAPVDCRHPDGIPKFRLLQPQP